MFIDNHFPWVFFDFFVILLATQLFKVLEKYRPETTIQKKNRLKAKAEAKVAKKPEAPSKRSNMLRSGTNTVTKLVEQKKAQLVVIAHDVDPIEVCILSLSNWSCNVYFTKYVLIFLTCLCTVTKKFDPFVSYRFHFFNLTSKWQD